MSGRRNKEEGIKPFDEADRVTRSLREEGRSRSGNKKSEGRGNRPNWFGPLRTS
ncbi:hypothetical protein QUB56_03825 [Microcoleus sp. AR_TQ3_B6]|uniref:hypothetical protein n=1 Tax=Microcoleus sp. AR_TQ3_B6 TaxID=3055284 RepID=UPI002FD14B6C